MVVSSGMKAMAFSPMVAGMLKGSTLGLGKVGTKALREPSIRELLKKENFPDKNKMKALDKRGSVKSPFAEGRPLNERLKDAGLTKDEAIKLSKVHSVQNQTQKPKFDSGANQRIQPQRMQASKAKPTIGKLKPIESTENNAHQFAKLRKQNFKFNQGYWDSINPNKAEAIKRKYGIEGATVDPNKIHRPVKSKLVSPRQKGKANELR